MTKQPVGRSAPMDSCYCASACPGYRDDPQPGHYWTEEEQTEIMQQVCDCTAGRWVLKKYAGEAP